MDPLELALRTLPHGPEFRFLDRLTELAPGHFGAAEFTLRGDEPFLRGHFPGEPSLPGVLLLEAAAQLAGAVAQSDPAFPPIKNLKLSSVRAAKILGTIRPGETVQFEARIAKRFGHLLQATVQARSGTRPLLSAELTLGGKIE